MIHAEVALYPLKTAAASQIINQSVQTLDQTGVEYRVGSMNTHLHGSEDQVWSGLRALFDAAQPGGEVSMVVTLTNAADDDDLSGLYT